MEIKNMLIDIFKKKYQLDLNVNEDTHLIDEIGFDSISMMELAKELGKKTNTKIPFEIIADWSTVGSIVKSF